MCLNRSCILLVVVASFALAAERSRYFRVEVVDAATGRGVPMVEIATTGHAAFVTDSRGLVAFDEPGLMGRDVWFGVKSPGYECPPDAFGLRGQGRRFRLTDVYGRVVRGLLA